MLPGFDQAGTPTEQQEALQDYRDRRDVADRAKGSLEASLGSELAEVTAALKAETNEQARDGMRDYQQAIRDQLRDEQAMGDHLYRTTGQSPDTATAQDWDLTARQLESDCQSLLAQLGDPDVLNIEIQQMRGAQVDSTPGLVGGHFVTTRSGKFSRREASRIRGDFTAQARETVSDALGAQLRWLGLSKAELAKIPSLEQRKALLAELGAGRLSRTKGGKPAKIGSLSLEVRDRLLWRTTPDQKATAGHVAGNVLECPGLQPYRLLEIRDLIMQSKLG